MRFLPDLRRLADGQERGVAGGRGFSRAAGAAVGVERSVPVALPICEPPRGGGIGRWAWSTGASRHTWSRMQRFPSPCWRRWLDLGGEGSGG